MTTEEAPKVKYCKRGHAIEGENILPYRASTGKWYEQCRECHRNNHRKSLRTKYMMAPSDTESVMASYKEPLKPVEGGFGYYGTIAYDKKTETLTQCHMCGGFYLHLHRHISQHKLSGRGYRERFSLPIGISLYGPKVKQPQHIRWAQLSPEERAHRIEILRQNRMRAAENRRLNGTHYKKSLYHKNLEGRCPDQLLDKIKQLADELGHTPTRREFVERWKNGYAKSVYLTFGSWTEAMNILNLVPNQGGGKPGQNQMYDRELLIKILIEFRDRYGREPMTADCNRGLLPTINTFIKYFGSWRAAKEYAK